MLLGHGQLYSLHKNRRHLRRYYKNVETKFDSSNYEILKPLPEGKTNNNYINKKIIMW